MGSHIQGSAPQDRIDLAVTQKYKVGKRIGRGCYGVVFEVQRTTVNPDGSLNLNHYAMKKVLSAFKSADEAQKVYREIMYLYEFGNHENILKIHDVMTSRDDRHLYIFTDLLDSDLQKALRVKALSRVHRIFITYQMLRALLYIHSALVVHRDVKPSNILLRKTCEVQLADFGWAREAPCEGESELMTDYAGSRWYRCPEMLLGSRSYNIPVDMWALGCITGEMYGDGEAVNPGSSTIDMIEKIIELTGKPILVDILALEAPRAQLTLEPVMPGPAHRPVEARFPNEPAEMHDFITLLLQWNPQKRLTAQEALSHPFVNSFANPDDEPVFGRRATLEIMDGRKMGINRYRDQIWADAMGVQGAKDRVIKAKKKELEEEVERERLMEMGLA